MIDHFVLILQPNLERDLMSEMTAAEQLGFFKYSGVSSSSEVETKSAEEKPAEAMIDRLQELCISAKDSNLMIASTMKSTVPEKITKLASNSRPLTVDDDDLDIDLEIDDNIDTTVSVFILLIFAFKNVS